MPIAHTGWIVSEKIPAVVKVVRIDLGSNITWRGRPKLTLAAVVHKDMKLIFSITYDSSWGPWGYSFSFWITISFLSAPLNVSYDQ